MGACPSVSNAMPSNPRTTYSKAASPLLNSVCMTWGLMRIRSSAAMQKVCVSVWNVPVPFKT